MRRILLALLAVMATFGTIRADKYTIDRSNLPQQAQDMLTEYFPKAKVGMIKVDKHLLKKTDYDVRLVNGTKSSSTTPASGRRSTARTSQCPTSW